jgi:hypothetical protein
MLANPAQQGRIDMLMPVPQRSSAGTDDSAI